jgi:hypothetical protein
MRRATAVVLMFSTAFLALPNVGSGDPHSNCPESSSCPYPHGRAPSAWYVGAGRIRPKKVQDAPVKAEAAIAEAAKPSSPPSTTAMPVSMPALSEKTAAMTPTRESHAAACPAGNCKDAEDARWEEFTAEQLEHLTKAAEHLVAGGFDDEAQQLLARIDQVRQKQIEETTAEIHRLQAKLVALQASGKRPITATKPSAPAKESLR